MKSAAKMQALAELAWVRLCERDGVVTSVVVEPKVQPVTVAKVSSREEEERLDLMMMVPEGYEDTLL